MLLRSAAALSGLAFSALFVNGLGAIAQERNGERGRGFPEWLYSASGYAFYASALCLLALAGGAWVAYRRRRG